MTCWLGHKVYVKDMRLTFWVSLGETVIIICPEGYSNAFSAALPALVFASETLVHKGLSSFRSGK